MEIVMPAESLRKTLNRNLLFVHGKGGVGKTAVSRAIATAFAEEGHKTLWIEFENPLREPGDLKKPQSRLHDLNADAGVAFEEYIGMKLGSNPVTRLFLQNQVIRYLAKAAPGIHELVLLGKVWHERDNYDRVVADMPSTGYALAMFQSTRNFADLFQGGPIHRDAEAMLKTMGDFSETGHLIVALPEEMPLRESLELDRELRRFFPDNPSAFLVNRTFPKLIERSEALQESPDTWPSPVPESALDYARKRSVLEAHNLRLWDERGLKYGELGFVPPPPTDALPVVIRNLSAQLQARGYL